MNEFVLSGLVKRRAEVAGELEATRKRAQQLHADLASLDAVIRQIDPAYPVETIKPKQVRALPAAEFAGMGRSALDALRQAREPLSIPAIAARVMALRCLDASSATVQRSVEDGVARALRHQRKAGVVREAGKSGRLVLWGLVE